MLKYILLGITGLSGGALVSAGVFALISSTGVMTRMAGKSHTAKNVRLYETMVILGGTWWNIFWVLSVNLNWNMDLSMNVLAVMGLCQGIFVGCLAVSLAEALNATAIFARRVKLKAGLSFVIFALAAGKVLSAFVQFINNQVK